VVFAELRFGHPVQLRRTPGRIVEVVGAQDGFDGRDIAGRSAGSIEEENCRAFAATVTAGGKGSCHQNKRNKQANSPWKLHCGSACDCTARAGYGEQSVAATARLTRAVCKV
jgi:hypothetical protein